MPDLALLDDVPLNATQDKEKIVIDILVGAMVFVKGIVMIETPA
jgi:hypothetical protein